MHCAGLVAVAQLASRLRSVADALRLRMTQCCGFWPCLIRKCAAALALLTPVMYSSLARDTAAAQAAGFLAVEQSGAPEPPANPGAASEPPTISTSAPTRLARRPSRFMG